MLFFFYTLSFPLSSLKGVGLVRRAHVRLFAEACKQPANSPHGHTDVSASCLNPGEDNSSLPDVSRPLWAPHMLGCTQQAAQPPSQRGL